MLYRINPKNGDALSSLGFGCMRFAEEKEAEKHVRHAIDQGVNYFDTAYIYPNNEATLGRIVSGGLRESIRIATKMPPYLVKKREDFDRIFDAQRKRLQTDHIDYYLLHMLLNEKDFQRLVSLGLLDWVARKKEKGEISQFGFSYHGGKPAFIELLDAHAWDFCMLQYNYVDEFSQAGRDGVRYAALKGVPVMVMEPLRGGRLAAGLPAEALAAFARADAGRTPAEWALRWVLNHPEALCVLSGMNTQAILEENIRIASQAEAETLTEAELSVYEEVRRIIMAKTNVPCTGCNYCMPCPHGVDIPMCFSCYNDMALEKPLMTRFYYIVRLMDRQASRCTGCGACEKHCPQGIAIRKELASIVRVMEAFPYRPIRFFARKFMKLS